VIKPSFITITGADNVADIPDMVALSNDFNIEWALLMSPTNYGTARYPTNTTQTAIAETDLTLAAHLCGRYASDVMTSKVPIFSVIDSVRWNRVQVNHRNPNPSLIQKFADSIDRPCIMQMRSDTFPPESSTQMLFDRSGGRGELPTSWPAYPGFSVGYAGRLTPDNVATALVNINATGAYWIDVETGVRTRDKFDLAKCRAFCEAVFGT